MASPEISLPWGLAVYHSFPLLSIGDGMEVSNVTAWKSTASPSWLGLWEGEEQELRQESLSHGRSGILFLAVQPILPGMLFIIDSA